MLTSLGLIFIIGLIFAKISNNLKLPRIIGMLITGILIGPFVLNLLDEKILGISSELRQIALIIILIKAGLSLDLSDLKKVGRPAILLSFLPATFEIIGYSILAPILLNIRLIDAALMGAVLSAVSPAVVVPRMVKLIDEGYGKSKAIPQMVLAGASCDDIFVIVLFTSFLAMAKGGNINVLGLFNIPVSIVLGLLIGVIVGFILAEFFDYSYKKGKLIRNSTKVIIILAISFLLMGLEEILKGKIAISALLSIVSMAMTIKIKSSDFVSKRLSEKYGKLWIACEVLLFVLVGAALNISYTLKAGIAAVVLILLALVFRSCGVLLSLVATNLSKKERLFTIISYLPKATVQAAIGSVPLAAGLSSGNIILSVAVMGILITAPLGAIGIDSTYKKLLKNDL